MTKYGYVIHTKGKSHVILSFRIRMKQDRNKARMKKLKNTNLPWNEDSLLSGVQCNALAFLVQFVTHTIK